MNDQSILYSIFLIFSGAAVLSTVALFTRQSLLVAYIVLGVAIGPWGMQLVNDTSLVDSVGDIGIIFLLFLLGLHLHPQNLYHMLRKVTWIALISSVVFGAAGYGIAWACGFTPMEALIVGGAMMFSSTIIGLKLLPTTILHHQHTGEVMISVLLMQDLIAIVVLIILNSVHTGQFAWTDVLSLFVSLPALLLIAFLMEKFVLVNLLARFDRTQEYVFLLSIGWCLGLAELAKVIGLSDDIGAFIAGVALAASPISNYIAESLKPLRDFFLVLFFFSIGAGFDFSFLQAIYIPALLLTAVMILIKPVLFGWLLERNGEVRSVSREVGVRLGQGSEFSLLLGAIAMKTQVISAPVLYLIQAATIFSFIISSYFVVLRYPTPIALTEKMRRD